MNQRAVVVVGQMPKVVEESCHVGGGYLIYVGYDVGMAMCALILVVVGEESTSALGNGGKAESEREKVATSILAGIRKVVEEVLGVETALVGVACMDFAALVFSLLQVLVPHVRSTRDTCP